MNLNTLTMTGRSALRVALLACCAAVVAAPALAQDPSGPPPQTQDQQGPGSHGGRRGGPEMQERQLEHMTKTLKLTPDQVTQIKAIQDSSRQKMMALRQDSSTAGEDKRGRMLEIREDQKKAIKATLTEDQKVKFDRMEERQMEHHDRGGQPPPAPPAPPSL